MRRSDRDVSSEPDAVRKCIRQSQVLSIALNADSVPYIIPLCFGEEEKDGKHFFYFHKAKDGTLNRLIGRQCSCTFSLIGNSSLFMDERKRTCNMNYASFIGKGIVYLVDDETERKKGVELIMKHYEREGFDLDMRAMSAILVYRIETEVFSVKATKGWKEENGCL